MRVEDGRQAGRCEGGPHFHHGLSLLSGGFGVLTGRGKSLSRRSGTHRICQGAAKNAYKVPSSCGPLREHDRANNNELPCVSCRTTLGSWLRGRFRGLCSHWFSHCIVCTCMPIICMKWPCVGDVQVDTETTAAPLARARTICLRGLCLSDKSPRKAGVESKMARCAFSWRPGPGGLSCIFGRTLLRD